MSVISGPKIINNGLIIYLDAFNEKSYSIDNIHWYDLKRNNLPSKIKNGAVFENNKLIIDNNKQYISIPNNNIINITEFTIDLWFIHSNVTYDKYENGLYKSKPERLLKISIGDIKFSIQTYFEEVNQIDLLNNSNKIYNLILIYNSGNITYNITDNNASSILNFSNIVENPSSTITDNIIGSILSLKIYNKILTLEEININFTSLKKR